MIFLQYQRISVGYRGRRVTQCAGINPDGRRTKILAVTVWLFRSASKVPPAPPCQHVHNLLLIWMAVTFSATVAERDSLQEDQKEICCLGGFDRLTIKPDMTTDWRSPQREQESHLTNGFICYGTLLKEAIMCHVSLR